MKKILLAFIVVAGFCASCQKEIDQDRSVYLSNHRVETVYNSNVNVYVNGKVVKTVNFGTIKPGQSKHIYNIPINTDSVECKHSINSIQCRYSYYYQQHSITVLF